MKSKTTSIGNWMCTKLDHKSYYFTIYLLLAYVVGKASQFWWFKGALGSVIYMASCQGKTILFSYEHYMGWVRIRDTSQKGHGIYLYKISESTEFYHRGGTRVKWPNGSKCATWTRWALPGVWIISLPDNGIEVTLKRPQNVYVTVNFW